MWRFWSTTPGRRRGSWAAPCPTKEDAIRIANESRYGLAAGVWTKDLACGHRVAHALEAGVVWVNTYRLTTVLVLFGSYKESGYGREYSDAVLNLYTETKSVYMSIGTVEYPTPGEQEGR